MAWIRKEPEIFRRQDESQETGGVVNMGMMLEVQNAIQLTCATRLPFLLPITPLTSFRAESQARVSPLRPSLLSSVFYIASQKDLFETAILCLSPRLLGESPDLCDTQVLPVLASAGHWGLSPSVAWGLSRSCCTFFLFALKTASPVLSSERWHLLFHCVAHFSKISTFPFPISPTAQ